ncbi:MAG: aconitate hydratase, partial [Clostridiales bacterium]|nr:aconitate hydratase [Clostridiales bacterium]
EIKAVIAKSFARIHMANLINSGIMPLTLVNEQNYDRIDPDDFLVIEDAITQVKSGDRVIVRNETKGEDIETLLPLSERLKKILLAGGMLNYTKMNS